MVIQINQWFSGTELGQLTIEEHGKFLGDRKFPYLNCVVVTMVYTVEKPIKPYTLNLCILLYENYTLIMD